LADRSLAASELLFRLLSALIQNFNKRKLMILLDWIDIRAPVLPKNFNSESSFFTTIQFLRPKRGEGSGGRLR
jgi:hypothetical protein